MYNIIDFIVRYKNTLLFSFLLFISLFLTIQSHSYQKSKFISSANQVTGGLYSWSNNLNDYFHLKENNRRLEKENARLRQRLFNVRAIKKDSSFIDTTHFGENYTVYEADVISNNYSKLDNYILINKGRDDSITTELGVITSNGLVGVVESVSPHYARIISILNTNLAINAQLKKSNHFGTLRWRGGNPNIVQLSDIPQNAKVKKGDTIITNGRSLIFPKGIPIGVVKDFKLTNEDNYYKIDVKLFNDMTNIGNVYIIRNNAKKEVDSLRSAYGQ